MSKIVKTCPEHKGYKLSAKGYCKKCKTYRTDGIEREPSAPIIKIDLADLTTKAPANAPAKKAVKLTTDEILNLLPPRYRNADLCPTCNPTKELKVCTNKHPVATDKTLDGWTVEQMVVYLRDQYNTAPDTNNIGQPVRPLVKMQIIAIQKELKIHKPN